MHDYVGANGCLFANCLKSYVGANGCHAANCLKSSYLKQDAASVVARSFKHVVPVPKFEPTSDV